MIGDILQPSLNLWITDQGIVNLSGIIKTQIELDSDVLTVLNRNSLINKTSLHV